MQPKLSRRLWPCEFALTSGVFWVSCWREILPICDPGPIAVWAKGEGAWAALNAVCIAIGGTGHSTSTLIYYPSKWLVLVGFNSNAEFVWIISLKTTRWLLQPAQRWFWLERIFYSAPELTEFSQAKLHRADLCNYSAKSSFQKFVYLTGAYLLLKVPTSLVNHSLGSRSIVNSSECHLYKIRCFSF